MGTRSTIALEFADGTVEQVYCHWDGYLDHNGAILKEHYSDPYKLRELIDLGDLSSLRPNIGTKHAFSQFSLPADQVEAYKKQTEDWCTFYTRDRGEDCPARKYKNYADYEANHSYEEYEYILRQVNGQAVWFVKCHSEPYKTLEQAMAEEAAGVIA